MSLSPETMMDLMAYADGELEASERARVEELLRSSDEARRVVAAMGTLGDVVREGGAELSPASARVADGIADGVMAKIARGVGAPQATPDVMPDVSSSRSGKVASLADARAARARIVAVAVAVVAIAAGVLIFVGPSKSGSVIIDDHGLKGGGGPVALGTAPVPASASAAAAIADSEPPGVDLSVDLEEAQSAQGKVDVFFTSSSARAGVASVVVWIDDRHGGH